ncbi:uncharacterized protein VTP21DRAFT_10435 [Calcarisporiella thermophila]|uniref:uncharacterized protein n=1 Tax=Calcarisporiella thermophila TaxID=911321 RepID=UPI003741F05D
MRKFTRLFSVFILVLSHLSTIWAKEMISLRDEDFDKSIAKGVWFIKFFAPWCPHCRALAPKWSELHNVLAPLEEDKELYIAEVDCTLNGDLCTKNAIKYYPTLYLFQDGVKIEEYNDDLEVASLKNYVLNKFDQLTNAPTSNTLGEKAEETNDNSGNIIEIPNPDGKLISLDAATFEKQVLGAPDQHWFIDMYAPWCDHCKRLAPTWEKLALSLKGQVNVAKIDCTTEISLCKSYNVKRFPTLKFFAQGGNVEYNGPRTLEAFQSFARKMAGSPIQEISAADLPKLKQDHESFFLFLYDSRTSKDEMNSVSAVARKYLDQVQFFKSKDPITQRAVGVSTTSLLVLKEGYQEKFSGPFLSNSIQEWVGRVRFPLLAELKYDNINDLFKGDRLIVLGIYDTNKPGWKTDNARLKAVALETYTRNPHIDVAFAWLDGVQWSRYIYRMYSLRPRNLPRIVIAHSNKDKYWDTDSTGRYLVADNSLIDTLSAIENKKILPKSSIGFLERTARSFYHKINEIGRLIGRHPFIALLIISGLGYFALKLSSVRNAARLSGSGWSLETSHPKPE